MKVASHFRIWAVLLLGMTIAGGRAGAQGFGLFVTNSASSILVGNSVTFNISVTNLSAFGTLSDAFVTNALPASAQIVTVTKSQGGSAVNGSTVVFELGQFNYGTIAQFSVTANLTAVGFVTNAVTVASAYTTETASNFTVVQVTNAVSQADVGVAMTGPAQAVITNDLMTYGVVVTNLGPDAAINLTLTNTLPPGVLFKSVFPNLPFTVASSNLIFNLGTLASRSATNFLFTVQPTNAGLLTFSAAAISLGVLDTNSANNTASTNISVMTYLPGTLTAVTNSSQNINFQNALTEQSITLSNAGPSSVFAARVVVTGLTNRLFNAVGTNNGSPFVYFSASLAAGQSVSLLLQFYPRSYFPFTNSQLHAFPVPVPNWTPPAATATSTNLVISRIVRLSNGNMLIEWPTTTNRTYTVVYSDNVSFSNAMIAPPSIVAPANRTQWIDYGPPTTISVPTNAPVRFYKVLLNQ